MKLIPLFAVVLLCCAGCVTAPCTGSKATLIEPLQPYVQHIASSLEDVPGDRRAMLDQIALTAYDLLASGKNVNMTFICTHNSRRSHMSQIWAQTAAAYYGLDHVHAFSGGTEMTACNCRTVAAMRRAGFSIVKTTAGENPVYLVQFSDDHPPVRAYSKIYNADGNPKQDYIALMTCSQADKQCPVVDGAIARYAIHYVDPKLCDDMPEEPVAYNERCQEIAREIFYIMARLKSRIMIKGQVI